MKSHTYFLIAILISSLVVAEAQVPHLQSIRIVYVSFGILPTADISCSEFESAFAKSTYSNKIFTDSILLRRFDIAIKTIQFSKSNPYMDVKVRIYLNYSRLFPEKILCVTKFYRMELDGRPMKNNRSLIKLLKEAIGNP